MPSGYDVGQLVAEIWVDTSEMNTGIQESKKILSSLESSLQDLAKNSVVQTNIMANGFQTMSNGMIHHLDAVLSLTSEVKAGFSQMGQSINQSMQNSNRNIQLLSSGFVTLRTGIDQCVVELRNLNTALNNIHPPANITNIIGSFNNITNSTNNASGGARGFLLSLSHISLYAYILYQDLRFVGNAIAGLFAPGLKFAQEMETTMIGMAGIISSSMQFEGKDIGFETSLMMANSILKDMKVEALSSTATLKELMETFQAILGPATALGMSLKEIKDFTVFGVSAVKSLGLNHQQLVQELRSIVGQSITVRGSTVATALGITNKDIDEAKTKVGGVFAFLKERMNGFELAAKANAGTISGMLSNLQDGIEQAQEKAFMGLIGKIHTELEKVQKFFFDIKEYAQDTMVEGKLHSKGSIQEAKLNPQTVEIFKKFADILSLAYDGIVKFATAISPLLGALGNLAYNGFILLSNVMEKMWNILSPLTSLIGNTLVEAITNLSNIIDYLNTNSFAQIIIATTAISILFYMLSSKITLFVGIISALIITLSDCNIAVKILAGTLAILSLAWMFVSSNAVKATVAMLSILIANPLILALVAVVDILALSLYAMAVAGEESVEWVTNAFKALGDDFAIIVYGMQLAWMKFINFFVSNLKTAVSLLKEMPVVGKLVPDSALSTMFDAEARSAEALTQKMGQLDGALASHATHVEGMQKSYGGIIDKMKNSFIHILPNVDEQETPQWLKDMMEGVTKKFPSAEKPDKGAKKAQRDAERQSMAEAEAIGKELIEQLKERQKELDYTYDQGIISVEKYYSSTKEINNLIMQVEKDMLTAKRDATSDKTQQIKLDGEIARLDEQFKIKEIELDRKRLKEYKEFYKEMASIHSDYTKLSKDNIISDAMEDTANKYSKQMLRIEQFANGAVEKKQEVGITAEQTALLDKQLDYYRECKRELQQIVTIKYGEAVLADTLNKVQTKELLDIAPKKQQIADDLAQNAITEYEAKVKTYALDKQKLDELMPLYEKQYAYFQAMYTKTEDPKYLTDIQNLKKQVMDLTHSLPPLQEELKKVTISSLSDSLTEAIMGTKNLANVITSLSEAVKKVFAKKIADKFAQEMANNAFPEDKKKDPFSDEGRKARIATMEAEFKEKGKLLYDTFYASAVDVKTSIESRLIPSLTNLAKMIDNIVKGKPAGEGMLNISNEDPLASKKTNKVDVAVATEKTKELTTLVETRNKFDSMLGGLTRFGGGIAMLTGNNGILKFATEMQLASSIMKMVQEGMKTGNWLQAIIGHANGGLIGGVGGGKSDSNLIKASRGEYMIQYDAVKKFGTGFFDQLNNGRLPALPAYATGGQVGGGSSSSSYATQQAPNIKIELINQTGTQAEATVGDTKFDGEQWVISMWLTGVSKNLLGSKDMMKGGMRQ